MKKFLSIFIVLILLVPTLLCANSVKYTSETYPIYNAIFSDSDSFRFTPLTFGIGFNTSTYFLNEKNNGFGVMAKMDVAFDTDNDNQLGISVLFGPTYQYTINRHLMLSCSLGPSLGVYSNKDESVSDSAVNFGLGADLHLMIHPTPSFGFSIGTTGYILPIGAYCENLQVRPQMYSISTYFGFVFSFGSKNEDSYYVPYFSPAELYYLNYIL